MFIALVGTPSAGKKTILKYLQDKHGFVQISLDEGAAVDAPAVCISRFSADDRKLLHRRTHYMSL